MTLPARDGRRSVGRGATPFQDVAMRFAEIINARRATGWRAGRTYTVREPCFQHYWTKWGLGMIVEQAGRRARPEGGAICYGTAAGRGVETQHGWGPYA